MQNSLQVKYKNYFVVVYVYYPACALESYFYSITPLIIWWILTQYEIVLVAVELWLVQVTTQTVMRLAVHER